MATGELGIEPGVIGVTKSEPTPFAGVGKVDEVVRTRVAEKWVRDGEMALEQWGKIIEGGVGNLAMAAARKETRPEVEEVMGAMRWLAANAPDKFRAWMKECGLEDKEIVVARGAVEAMGDKDRLPDAVWGLKEAMKDDLETLEGGDVLLKILSAVRLPSQSGGESEQDWGDVYGGGMAGGEPGGPPPKPDREEDRKKQAAADKTRGIVTRRQFLITALTAGGVGLCAWLGLIKLGARGWGEAVGLSGDKAEGVSVDEKFIPVMGDKLASEALVKRMFWEEGEVEDPEHRVIEVFLRTYGTATPDVKAARGESMLEELEKQGLLQKQDGVVNINEEALRSRLMGEGYTEEEVDELIRWSEQYLQDRDKLLAALVEQNK